MQRRWNPSSVRRRGSFAGAGCVAGRVRGSDGVVVPCVKPVETRVMSSWGFSFTPPVRCGGKVGKWNLRPDALGSLPRCVFTPRTPYLACTERASNCPQLATSRGIECFRLEVIPWARGTSPPRASSCLLAMHCAIARCPSFERRSCPTLWRPFFRERRTVLLAVLVGHLGEAFFSWRPHFGRVVLHEPGH